MTLKIIDLPNGNDAVCFKGVDADNKDITHYVCAVSLSADAVHLAFIDEVQGRPSISHVVVRKDGHETKEKYLSALRKAGSERFKDFDRYKEMEDEFLEQLYSRKQK